MYSKIERLKQFIVFFIEKYQPVCGLCGGEVSWKSFFPVLSHMIRDEFTIHHKNHIRKDNRPINKAIVHRDCHRRHHRNLQVLKETGQKIIKYSCYENIAGKFTKEVMKIPSERI